MRSIFSYVVLFGLVTTLVAQLYIVVRAFQISAFKGFLCLVIPGYILFFATTRDTRETKALILWGMGLLLFIVGLVAS